MANHPEYSAYLKRLLIDAARGELSMVGSDEEDACARWIAYGTINFLVNRVDVGIAAATDVTTWKRLSDAYGAFDVQVGYVAGKPAGIVAATRARTSSGRSLTNVRLFPINRMRSDCDDPPSAAASEGS